MTRQVEASTPGRSTPLRILLVEDSPHDARLIGEMMGDAADRDFVLTHVVRLEEALRRLDGEVFDAVLLDLGLPDSQGLDTLNSILSKASQAPIVVLTGLADEEIGIQAIQVGAQDYLVKNQIDDTRIVSRALHFAIERKRADELEKEIVRLETEIGESSLIEVRLRGQSVGLDVIDRFLDGLPACGNDRDRIRLFLRVLIGLTGAGWGFVMLSGGPNGGWWLELANGEPPAGTLDKMAAFLAANPPWSDLLNEGQGRLIGDAAHPANGVRLPDGFPAIETLLLLPIHGCGGERGIACAANKSHSFLPDDLEHGRRLGRLFSLALGCRHPLHDI